MTRRALSIGLWGYFGWYLAAHMAALLELPLELAPLGGVVLAVIASYDWHQLTYWLRGDLRGPSSS